MRIRSATADTTIIIMYSSAFEESSPLLPISIYSFTSVTFSSIIYPSYQSSSSQYFSIYSSLNSTLERSNPTQLSIWRHSSTNSSICRFSNLFLSSSSAFSRSSYSLCSCSSLAAAASSASILSYSILSSSNLSCSSNYSSSYL